MTFADLALGSIFVFVHSPSLDYLKVKVGGRRWSYAGKSATTRTEGSLFVIPLTCSIEPTDEPGEYTRAGGGATCRICGRLLYNHPFSHHHGYAGPYLRRLCDGSLVKL